MPDTSFFFTIPVDTSTATITTTNYQFPPSPPTPAPKALIDFETDPLGPFYEEQQSTLPDENKYSNFLDGMLGPPTDSSSKKPTASEIYTNHVMNMLEKLGIKPINFKKEDIQFGRDARTSSKVFNNLADILYEWKHNDLQNQEEEEEDI